MEAGSKDYYRLSPSQLPSPPPPPPPPPAAAAASSSFLSRYNSLDSKISPSVLLIITILAVIFFLSGLVHLLIRYLFRPTAREAEESDNVTAFQGQLQQLFHLHDAGVDQSFIDALPVFLYEAIIGVKDPFDCAVCLCEFEPDDKLRLLPKCSHAFHIECIDTWLLSHSTCPLCRGSLLSDFPPAATTRSPLVLVLEASGESSREIVPDHALENSNVGLAQEEEILEKAGENVTKEELSTPPPPETKIVAVKLGKFRNLDPAGGVGGSSSTSNNLDGRRCFSMGSFEYVMDEKSLLQVAIKPPEKKPGGNKPHRRRLAMSECDCHSQREGFRGFEPVNAGVIPPNPPPTPSSFRKRESFSFSKTWLRSKKERPPVSSAVDPTSSSSFRLQQEPKQSREEGGTMASELDSGSEFDMDVEVGSCNNSRALSTREETPSFSRRTLLWVIGRNQNHKVVNHI